ncbi:2-oxo-4-hydroxy-4-carboxy-5-ureidoimidazoline decarboxylase [Glaciecola petra]|uniref:2-oxo-4-hydroxy-4-carboxy-5-ureidoimidazoline decarboxylase n=1 Tax=Glaciecola petra TaxID=3075602 RepID=A0ABU2ZUW5_9ALTE|nr:2-oxo-4-hydroxy-4-carboxy-5-ureidoimidazoline decarboxylase [Aestuariibacter sp. P117]MDT0596180.1 2-oxo-4-hydroxy-4-carboxy-5-ureidoimidazoline decarboxylase [Aestuariibacter sp. P117]
MTITSIEQLNLASPEQAYDWFLQTCSSEKWCYNMLNKRPFDNLDDIKKCANDMWQTMQTTDLMEAFSGHPMIGDMSTLRAKYANTSALASHEQSGVQTASEAVLAELHAKNKAYLEKHGFIFIIFASGLSAKSMLKALLARLPNNTATELQNAAQEQIKITVNRIEKALKAD